MNDEFRNLLKIAIGTQSTQKEFAAHAGLSNEHVSRMLQKNNLSKPNIETLKKIVQGSDGRVSLVDLFTACGYSLDSLPKEDAFLLRMASYYQTLQEPNFVLSLKQSITKIKRKMIFYRLYDFALYIISDVSELLDFKLSEPRKCEDESKVFAEYEVDISFGLKVTHHEILQTTIYYCQTEKGYVLITDIGAC